MTEPATVRDTSSTATSGDSIIRVSAWPGDENGPLRAAKRVADGTSVVATGPTGIDEYEPLVLVTSDGETRFYASLAASETQAFVRAVEAGDSPDPDPFAVVHHGDIERLPVPADGPLAVGDRRLLAKCGWANPVAPSDWSLVSEHVTPDTQLPGTVRGRGRGDAAAGTPVAETWTTVRESDGDPVVVVNAHDTDPRHRSDEVLLAGATVAVLDAAATVGKLVGAEDVVVLLHEDSPVVGRVKAAIEELGERLAVTPQVAVGPAVYRAGDPTAALEVLEGADRIEPRRQPPSPASHGLYGRPTAVHSVRTLLQARATLQRELPGLSPSDGAVEEALEGDGAPSRLFSVTGDVESPAVVEISADESLSTVRAAVTPTDGVQMACVGGIFGGLTDTLGPQASAEAVTDTGLGATGGVEILGTDRCPVAETGERVQFAAEENSGRCVPGREGTQQLAELLRKVYAGEFDEKKIRELARVMRRSANCQLGATAPRPVTTALDRFGAQFHDHADGHCPSGVCSDNL